MRCPRPTCLLLFGVLLLACGDDPAAVCGDGVISIDERCDGATLGDLSCESLGFEAGPIGCTSSCVPDTSMCGAPASCGDGELSAPEVCDGDRLGGATCESEGFGSGGTLACASNCGAYDTSACSAPLGCGDGVLADDEVCDGESFRGDCESLGFGPGALACDRCVAVDTSGCACLPTTCEAAGANCGELADGCGVTLNCGDRCAEPWLSCGGAGTDNRCGAACDLSCPGGSDCDEFGVCPLTMPINLDIRTSPSTFRVLRSGVTPTDTVDCSNPERIVGFYRLVNLDLPGGASTGVVNCGTDWTFGPLDLPPGTYRFGVRGRSAADTNMPPPYYGAEVRVDGGEVSLDVPVHRVQGNLRRDGAAPIETASCVPGSELARLRFETGNVTDEPIVTPVLCGSDFAFDVDLYPGTWEVYLDSPRASYSDVGEARRLLRAFAVDAPTGGAVIELTDRRVVLSGQLRFGGELPVAGSACVASREASRVMLFREGEFEAFGPMPCNSEFDYEITVDPGEYEVVYRTSTIGDVTNLPIVNNVPLGTRVFDTDTTLDIDVPRRSVSGSLTVDGMPLPETASCSDGMVAGNLRVQGRLAQVMCGTGGSFALADLAPVELRCLGDGCAAPTTTEATFEFFPDPAMTGLTGRLAQAFDLADPREPFDLDFDSTRDIRHDVAIRFTLDGAAPPETCTGSERVGQLNLSSPTRGAGTGISCGTNFTGVLQMPDGEYQVQVVGTSAAPVPNYMRVEPLVVAGADVSVVLDIPTVLVEGSVTVNGETPVRNDECTRPDLGSNVHFYDLRRTIANVPTVSFFMPCETTDFTFSGRVPVGVYRVTVNRSRIPFDGPSGSTLPGYEHTLIERLDVR